MTAARMSRGNILTNAHFPNMKGLADYIHSEGDEVWDLLHAGADDVPRV